MKCKITMIRYKNITARYPMHGEWIVTFIPQGRPVDIDKDMHVLTFTEVLELKYEVDR